MNALTNQKKVSILSEEIKTVLLCTFAFLLLTSVVTAQILPPHPTIRTTPAPSYREPAHVNPPSLLWPLTKGNKVRYAVRLSQNRDFTGEVFEATKLRWGIYNPHRKLGSGTWYWQYAVTPQPDKVPKWSEVLQFSVSDELCPFVTPPSSDMLAAAHKSRPRIPAKPALTDKKKMRRLLKQADRLLEKQIPSIDKAAPKEQGNNKFEQKVFTRVASKKFVNSVLGQVKKLVRVYRLTGDERYGRKALEYGLFVASLDPDGVTAPKISDFADGSCMQVLSRVYDGCQDLITPHQKWQLCYSLQGRTSRFFKKKVNNLEAKVFSAHLWQHILAQATEGALTLIGDVPEAEEWLAYVYELWIAKFPNLSQTDGAWANGISYFSTNYWTMLDIPTLFGQLTGVDFFNHPWYCNALYYLMYCWPPDSVSDGFGDGSESDRLPTKRYQGTFALELGKHFKDPYALWYAEKIIGKLDSPPVAPKPPVDLPMARAFMDVGIVAMHNDLIDAADNLMISFRSSPYGAYNHMHRDQNSFNINFSGERLFSGSGYYISYSDDHFKEWYTHTRGQNSIMIDGKGQIRGSEGFGRIIDYKHTTASTYCVGDASHAYGDEVGLRTFRRHLLFLRPSVLLVYDELEAGHKAHWEWMLHSPNKLTINGKVLSGGNRNAKTRVDFFASSQLSMNSHTRFDPPAVNWRKKNRDGKIIEYPDQWHFAAVPATPQDKLRILAVIQVQPTNGATSMDTPRMQGDILSVAGKQVQVELSPHHPALMKFR